MVLSRRSVAVVTVMMGVMSTGIIAFPAAGHADPAIDALIADVEVISRDATARSEEVKQHEIAIEEQQHVVDAAGERAKVTSEDARIALEQAKALRGDVNDLARSKYKGTSVDSAVSALAARCPQAAIDRSGYLAVLSDRNRRIVESLKATREKAADLHQDAAVAKAEADYQLATLKKELADLEVKREELERRVNDVQHRVDSLSPELKEAWINKNGPIKLLDAHVVTGTNQSGVQAVYAALRKIGSPYGWGATGPDVFDCSGLIVWAYLQQGKVLPRTSQAQMTGGTPVPLDQLQPGDVIGYWPGATHVGMYIGDGRIVHASDYGIPVQVVPMDSMPIYGARRY